MNARLKAGGALAAAQLTQVRAVKAIAQDRAVVDGIDAQAASAALALPPNRFRGN